MTSFTFIHTADIHLDSGFRGIGSREDEAAELVRDATRRAFTGLVDAAIERAVDFMVIAGDLYDGEWPDTRTAFFVRGELARLREAGIAVYLAKGFRGSAGGSDVERRGKAVPVSRLLIIVGVLLVAAGLLWPLITKLGLGRLPGDIVIERENFRLYVPLTSAIIVSVVLSLVVWLFRRL